MKPIQIVLLYQSLLGIYGDRGNAMVLRQRLRWRGIDAILTEVEPGDPVPASGAVYLLGGGEDAAQISAVNALKADGRLFDAVADGAELFAVCAGYQIAGRTFTVGEHDEVIDGLGLLDVTTRRGRERAVGEILSRWLRPDEMCIRDRHGFGPAVSGDRVPSGSGLPCTDFDSAVPGDRDPSIACPRSAARIRPGFASWRGHGRIGPCRPTSSHPQLGLRPWRAGAFGSAPRS